MNLTTRELLYLEDISKMLESVDKNCTRGAQNTNDQQIKAMLQNLSQTHQQWMQSVASMVTNNGRLQ